MNTVMEWFVGLATIDGFLYFLAGFVFAYLSHYVRAKLKHKKITIPWHLAGIAIGIGAIVVVTFQSQMAYSTAKETAIEVQLCQKEFNQALKDRTRIASENDQLSIEQRLVFYTWIHELIFPPPPYDMMDPNDPARQLHAITITQDTDRSLEKSFEKQNELQAARNAKPLPDPTCGK